ncbi:helix-turn-helix transcriptional regulator [Aeromonas sanarellii]|uniref:helix-turn-helix transcriptional regulator n=1 Tax=Aeromonas veronii TaxID=654 RepID=UPI00244366DD|nr:AlpA family phage regulatory protein [Aeromonas veronii]
MLNQLPQTGFIRQAQLVNDPKKGTSGLLPISQATLWRWVAAGKFPAPVKLSDRVTAWRSEDVRIWIDSQAVKAAA